MIAVFIIFFGIVGYIVGERGTPVPGYCHPMSQWLLPPTECVPWAMFQAWCFCIGFFGVLIVVVVIWAWWETRQLGRLRS